MANIEITRVRLKVNGTRSLNLFLTGFIDDRYI
jgi:hypothetical protein